MVGHKHVTVNGGVANIPSYVLKPGDVISIKESSRIKESIKNFAQGVSTKFPWLEWNADKMQGTFLSVPEKDQIPENIKVQLIVELYSK